MDKVIVSGARVEARIGVTEEERAQPQPLVIDVELEVDTREAARTDDLRFSADYAAVWRRVAEAARRQPYALVETLAGRIAAVVMEEFAPAAVRVRVKKPGALRAEGVDWAGVEILRRRGD